jgi:hypothetical protein
MGLGYESGSGMIRALAVLLALALPVHADDEHRPVPPLPKVAPWMTGAQLVQKLSSPAEARDAELYIKGAHDATERKEWCFADRSGKAPPKPRPPDLQAFVLNGLHALPPAELKRNAADLIIELWQDKWPCPPDGCCP